ncbi:MAG: S8 family serine peptidase [Anaerolineaceae bacterium]|nr:S8 family serine peptidase [Anaerolineaceae bacterium]
MKAFRWISLIVILSMVFSVSASPQTVKAQSLGASPVTRSTLFVPGEVVVAFNGATDSVTYSAQATALSGQVGAQVVGSYGNTALLSFAANADVQTLAKQISSTQGIKYAEPNYISWVPEADAKIKGIQKQLTQITRKDKNGKTHTIPVQDLLAMRTISHGKSVPTYANDMYNSWGVSWSRANVIWTETAASPQVCVLDTGVDITHPDLATKVVAGWDFINNDATVVDDFGHGTHVAGTIAAKANDGVGPAGISNGQVLAVKVLSSQGWGTDFDIFEGLEYCASKPAVKVINMSLGGPFSQDEAQGVADAVAAGKLIVAAAGNASTSDESNAYPAAFADSNNSSAYISASVISVAAARSPWSGSNGDGTIGIYNGSETDAYYNCATDFSNYGSWVNIVAPGEDIYSTTPYSSPFWLNFYEGISPKYDYLSGTSMATPHVAGAAARVWSLNKNMTNNQVKNLLIQSGTALNIVEDPAFTNASDQTQGYNGDYDPTGITGEGPFCWPSSMSSATYLDVAAAMGRGAIESNVYDANTGLPLVNGTVQALINGTKTVKATGVVASAYSSWVDLIDLPVSNSYALTVSASGYTSGIQPYIYGVPVGGKDNFGNNLTWQFGSWDDAAVPPNNKNFTVVANWGWGYELGLFLWLPYNYGGVIGPWDPYTSGTDYYQGAGTLLNVPGSPFARLNRDEEDGMGLSSIGVVSSGVYPVFNSAYQNQVYDVLMADTVDGSDLTAASPIVRVWYGGKPNWLAYFPNCTGGNNWWHAGSFYRSGNSMQYAADGTCGTGDVYNGVNDGVWPYSKQAGVTIKSSNQTAK